VHRDRPASRLGDLRARLRDRAAGDEGHAARRLLSRGRRGARRSGR
jgi:hypothetical protein